ncbi:MAG: 30S ribosome-binding factor RbfA [Anaerolineae bacterium]
MEPLGTGKGGWLGHLPSITEVEVTTRRQRRIAELIHRELSQLLMEEVYDPRVVNVTITDVELTPDLMLARVYFAVLGDAEQERDALTGLEHAKGFLRTQLAGRVQLRFIPDLSFLVDKSSAYGRRIDELLDQIATGSYSPDESEPIP